MASRGITERPFSDAGRGARGLSPPVTQRHADSFCGVVGDLHAVHGDAGMEVGDYPRPGIVGDLTRPPKEPLATRTPERKNGSGSELPLLRIVLTGHDACAHSTDLYAYGAMPFNDGNAVGSIPQHSSFIEVCTGSSHVDGDSAVVLNRVLSPEAGRGAVEENSSSGVAANEVLSRGAVHA